MRTLNRMSMGTKRALDQAGGFSMDELIQQVAQRTGLPAEQARQAAEAVIGFLKERLPAPLASQLDSVVKGGGAGGLGNIASSLGGMFGGGGNNKS